ncbi:MAG: hypothetical protein Q8Q12_15035 [bacterium]|nr:hypothetical protein [bacterium]
MAEKEGNGVRKRSDSRGSFLEATGDDRPQHNDSAVTGILDERIENLREAIEEIDDALAGRKTLNREFIQQIDAEAEEVKRHLNMLQPPWKTGFYPEVEFLRLSFHKSLTSRAKERRTEELKYWENGVNLAKEKRKFLDEYKALQATRRRLRGP